MPRKTICDPPYAHQRSYEPPHIVVRVSREAEQRFDGDLTSDHVIDWAEERLFSLYLRSRSTAPFDLYLDWLLDASGIDCRNL